MSGDSETGRAGQAGLETVHDGSTEEKSQAAVVTGEIRNRWQIGLAILTLVVTSGLLWYMDGGFSLDAIIFAVLAALLLVYFAITLVNDVRLE